MVQVVDMLANAAKHSTLSCQQSISSSSIKMAQESLKITKTSGVDSKTAGQVTGAQTNLGNMGVSGKEVAQNCNEATQWCHNTADQGLAKAQRNLGAM